MNIRFCGFGGQGILLSGYIYGHAAVLDGLNALQTQSYGSESRGGACKSDVVISKEDIHDLEVEDCDVLVAMSQPAHDTFLKTLKQSGTLIYEKDMVIPDGSVAAERSFGISATDIAYKQFKRKIIANMVMNGYLAAITKVLGVGSIEEAIRGAVPAGTDELNISAFREGHRLGEEARK
jgi:2-oxoglutarate ferredoxin oxidoreductase subunit gamma